jgi:beta-galactosidase
MKTGACYYPELSTPLQWKQDLLTAHSLGLSALRCGEFAWSRLSPQLDEWEAGWAMEFLEFAGNLGFEVIWCTPSATPPPYVFDRWPDLHAFDDRQEVTPAGVRRNYCPSHLGYRELCAETAARLVRELGSQPTIKGWQIDNEIAGDGFTCWCPRCNRSFQSWLEQRYGTLDALNEAWRSAVWSQCYTQWNQIPIPQKAFAGHAPALKLAWRRFRSDNWLAFYLAQQAAMKTAGATQPVTTNFFGVSWDIPFDQWAWRPYLDTMSIGQYVEDDTMMRFELALLKGIDHKALWVLEQKAGQQRAQNVYPESLDRLGHHLRVCKEMGAEYSIYWHLRQHLSGCEMEHGAVLRHDGKATRIGEKIKEGIAQAEAVQVAAPKSNCILVFDFHQNWAQDERSHQGSPWRYREPLGQDWYGATQDLWAGCPVGSLVPSLKQARLILAPHLQMMGENDFEAIKEFLQNGGIFVTTADFGRLDFENNVRSLPPLGSMRSLSSVPAGEMLHLKADFTVVGQWEGKPLRGKYFWFVPEKKSIIHLEHEEMTGPAFLEFGIGSGRMYVLACAFDRTSLATILPHFVPSLSSD